MGRRLQAKELYVYIDDQQVGTLTRLASGELTFQYADTWLSWEFAHPISLSLPLTESCYSGEVIYNFFDNLLPDSYSIRERIQRRFGLPSKHCFDLLACIGRDCIGALQLLSDTFPSSIKAVSAIKLDDETIAKHLKDYLNAPLGMKHHSEFRISLAGAQEKTALLWYQDAWCLPERTTPTSHIIKLPIGRIEHSNIDLSDSVENEWLCLKLLSMFGLSVPEVNIVEFSDCKTLVIERFDRVWMQKNTWLKRVSQEDMCQALALPSVLKYEADGGPGIVEIMNCLRGSHQSNHDRYHFMKSVFLFWVLGAIDGHAKNFSVFLKSKGRFSLTPLYDVLSAFPYKTQLRWKNLKMAMALRGKSAHYRWDLIQPRHWFVTAQLCQFPKTSMQQIIDEVFDEMESVIEEMRTLLPVGFNEQLAEVIFTGMQDSKSLFSLAK